MVLLKFLSGKQAGFTYEARRFPVRLGRAATAEVRSEDPGVWDNHAALELQPDKGFVLISQPEAPTLVNDQRIESLLLRNGDTLSLGSLKLQFWIGPTRQSGLRFREWLTWAGIAAITLGQVALIYWLVRQV